MPETIAILGATGKLGGATLSALLSRPEILAPSSPSPSPATSTTIVALTSSQPGSEKWTSLELKAKGKGIEVEVEVEVRHAAFEDPASLQAALRGVSTFFLVSTPDVALDFGDDQGPGREAHHRAAVDAAARAGVRRLVYTSLAFAFGEGGPKDESKAGVMRAHLRTEAYLKEVAAREKSKSPAGSLREVVAIREGLYSESWPLYLGYFAPAGDDERAAVKLAGDGKVCWTAIADLGIANALVLAAPPGAYDGYRSFYLSTQPAAARSLAEVAALVAEARGKELRVEVVGSREEHVRHYVEERGLPGPAVRWWVGTYEALGEGECLVDDPALEELLARVGARPTPFEETVRRMVAGGSSSTIS